MWEKPTLQIRKTPTNAATMAGTIAVALPVETACSPTTAD
jgi:hypothetical protein